jgi:hypothetical protein
MKSPILFGFVLAAAQFAHANMTIKLSPAATLAATTVEPAVTTASTSAAEPAATTAAPGTFYDKMPMEAYKSGGYKELECGYGHVKQEDGSCKAATWVRPRPITKTRHL